MFRLGRREGSNYNVHNKGENQSSEIENFN